MRTGLVLMSETPLTEIDVTDIVWSVIVDDPASDVKAYFGRLIDAVFNRPRELEAGTKVTFTKTEIRQMYKRAYPKAKV